MARTAQMSRIMIVNIKHRSLDNHKWRSRCGLCKSSLFWARLALLVVECLCSCPMARLWLSRPQFGSVPVLLRRRKGTLVTGYHFAFLCSRARIAMYCYTPLVSFLLTLDLV